MNHDFLSVYDAKTAEYLLAVSYLLLFVPFWTYLQHSRRPAIALAPSAGMARQAVPARAAPARANVPSPGAGWFEVPAGVWLHPGHTWARLETDGTVAIGLDDLAHRLLGAQRASLPEIGSRLSQGEAAMDLSNGDKSVSALSPVDGTVVAVNTDATLPRRAATDPYGAGWFLKVKPLRLGANLRQLETGSAAQKLLDLSAELLAMRVDPRMATVLQDGGSPVHGIAAALAGDDWDAFAREFLRS